MLKKIAKRYESLRFRVSPFLLVYFMLFTVLGKTYEGFAYIVALIIHEFSHAEEARKRGYTLNGMHFTVFGAALKMEMQSMKSEDERAIAIAGPVSNFCLAVICTALWWLFPSTYFFTLDFVWANLSLLIFNLFPVYPLDGGRIMLSILLEKTSGKHARKILKIVGYTISFILFVFFALSLVFKIFNPSFLLVGIFVITSTLFPEHTVKYERLYRIGYRRDKLKRGLEIKEIAVPMNFSVQKAYGMLNSDKFTCFVVVDESLIPRKIITETLIEEYYDKVQTLGEIVAKV